MRELEREESQTIDGDHGRIEERTYRVTNIPRLFTKNMIGLAYQLWLRFQVKERLKGIFKQKSDITFIPFPKMLKN